MISYPSFMPAPQIDYSYSNQTGTLTQQMESGYTIQRARQTRSKDIVKATFKFSFSQLAVWEGFVVNTLNMGAAEFLIKLPNPANQDISDITAIIQGGLFEPTAIAGEAVWQVSCILILQKKEAYSDVLIYMLEIFGGDMEAFLAWEDAFNTLVNETIPNNYAN